MIIVTGRPHSGKSTLIRDRVGRVREAGGKVAGILARGLWQDGIRDGFDLTDLSRNETTPLCRRIPGGGLENGIPFAFSEAGLEAGYQALSPGQCEHADVAVVDEVGFLELDGRGWGPCLGPLLELKIPCLIWVVQSVLVERVCRRWGLMPEALISVEEADAVGRLEAVSGV